MSALAEQLRALAIASSAPVVETAHLLDLHVQANTAVQPDGSLAVIDSAGNPRLTSAPGFPVMTIVELLAEARETMPALFQPIQADVDKKEASETLTATQRMRNAKIARDAAEAAARKPAADTENPFSTKTMNVTKQMILLRTDPALAEQMKAAAIAETKK